MKSNNCVMISGNFQSHAFLVQMKSKPSIKPPRLADKLFEWYCDNAATEDLHGDMEELFYCNLEKMPVARAKRKYWQQTFSFIFLTHQK